MKLAGRQGCFVTAVSADLGGQVGARQEARHPAQAASLVQPLGTILRLFLQPSVRTGVVPTSLIENWSRR